MTHPKRERPGNSTPVLGPDGTFSSPWLRGKSIAPVPAGSHVDAALTRRIAAGCRAVGAPHVLCVDLASSTRTDPADKAVQFPIGSGYGNIRPPSVFYTPDRQGGVLFQESGYALVAGTDAFMAAAVGEGVDAARARFSRYARTLSDRHPGLTAVATAHPPARRAWAYPADVSPGSEVGRQLSLLNEFTDGTRSAPEFARDWWEARRASQANGERIQAPLSDLFDQVFMMLEDYAVDPDLREPGDLTDAEIQAAVREIWDPFRRSITE
ncbi:colicin immunity domain-containing protein [Streptomyces graminofaciens]|uniref:colicin immunity domain-containing protein n=1 Tax=Streptomyces graminofaciens TaxID=68212 RepID=UPI0025743125|nr:colicin immunity domain-containing protein [Streptomyces graminofaciens]